jgi:hypothetical protein
VRRERRADGLLAGADVRTGCLQSVAHQCTLFDVSDTHEQVPTAGLA